MNSIGFIRQKVLGDRKMDWLLGGKYSFGKGAAFQTMPPLASASMCPKADNQNRFSTEKSVR